MSDKPPFGNAWEYMSWDDNNCGQCIKDACEIKDAYLLGSVSEPIPDGINERAGYQGSPRWWCKEGVSKEATTPQGDGHISPAQAEGKEPPEPRGYLVAQCV